jgi:hypothetical protein
MKPSWIVCPHFEDDDIPPMRRVNRDGLPFFDLKDDGSVKLLLCPHCLTIVESVVMEQIVREMLVAGANRQKNESK